MCGGDVEGILRRENKKDRRIFLWNKVGSINALINKTELI